MALRLFSGYANASVCLLNKRRKKKVKNERKTSHIQVYIGHFGLWSKLGLYRVNYVKMPPDGSAGRVKPMGA
jgi:hypothetical protein